MSPDLKVTMGGMEFQTPLLTGSGTFGYGDEFLGLIDYSPLGGIVTKSITAYRRPGNPPPRICETPGGGVINSIGLANPGVDVFMAEKASILPVGLTRVFLSVFGETVEEFAGVISKLETIISFDGYELNLSCPNVSRGGIGLGGDIEVVGEIVREVRSLTKRFVSVKLTPHQTRAAPLAEAAVKAGADALTMTNTLVGMMIDVGTRRPLLGSITGGYSGPPLKPVALAKVWQAAQAVNVPIWASGGIVNGLDCVEFMLAGATGLQLGSVLFADPYAPSRIIREIEEYCCKYGISKVAELIGAMDKPR